MIFETDHCAGKPRPFRRYRVGQPPDPGDGYRLLKDSERIQAGDEYLAGSLWKPLPGYVGSHANSVGWIRRRFIS